MDAITHFRESVTRPGSKLAALWDAGWEELCPNPTGPWRFMHDEFPGVIIYWSPGMEPQALTFKIEA